MNKPLLVLILLLLSAFLKAQSNTQTQLQIGFHYITNNDYPIFYRNTHPTKAKDYKITKSDKSNSLWLQIFVQSDSAKSEIDSVKLSNGMVLHIAIRRKKYVLNTYDKKKKKIISHNRDIIHIDTGRAKDIIPNDVTIIAGVNDFPFYDNTFELPLKGVKTSLRITILKDLQVKTIPDFTGTYSTDKRRKSIDGPDSILIGPPLINIFSQQDIEETKLPYMPGESFTNITPDSTNKGILYLNFYRNASLNKFVGDDAVINPNDTLGVYYMKIQSKVNVTDYNYYISRRYAAWDIGALTVPLKWVLANSAVSYGNLLTNINAGVYFGREWGSTRFYINSSKNYNPLSVILSGFVNTTSLTLTTANTNNSLATGQTSVSVFGISYGGGIQLGVHNIDIAFLAGADIPISQGTDFNWEYYNKLWVGIGISYNVGIFGNGGGGGGSPAAASASAGAKP